MGLLDKLKAKLNGEKISVKKQKKTQNDEKIEKDEISKVEAMATDENEKVNGSDEKTHLMEEQSQTEVVTIKPKATKIEPKNKTATEKVKKSAANAEELQELTLVKIMRLLKNFSFSSVMIQTIRFHLKNVRTDVYAVRAEKLFNGEDFLDLLKAEMQNTNVSYAHDMDVQLVFGSPKFDAYSLITEQVSVEVLTPREAFEQKEAKITTLSGALYQQEYILDPKCKKPYLIGRGKAPKLPTGRIIRNDIAFVEPTEGCDKEVALNKYVSRSIVLIAYNTDTNKYEVGRTNFMFDSKHVVKVNRIEMSGNQKEIRLNTPKIRVPLEDEDMITINGKVNLLFELIK